MTHREAYAKSGVNVEAGYEAVRLMASSVARTRVPGVLTDLGGFGGAFELPKGLQDPILVSGTDGVGTKLKLAFLMDRHDTVGIDCVAMCVNDVLCCGARPLFFLDYVAVGRNVPERVAAIVSGVAEGCVQAGCALIGGETAEMPGFYPAEEYDLAGFAVGIVERAKMLDRRNVQSGDVLIALPSSGLHSNGFSLVRRALDVEHRDLRQRVEELGCPLGEALLTPTRIYVKPVTALLEAVDVHSLAHITGGGFHENIPRSVPEGMGVRIRRAELRVPPIFEFLMREGGIDEEQMFHVFNMGVGMTATVAEDDAEVALRVLRENGVEARPIGSVVDEEGVVLC
ncbi:phosphoribosylformylglycinamidine cyclo-ligase [uncultured Fretibacterium sp.]|uniref:phosphoribosylformylglycinamidine cyclo-ligase n=1 Tax=uncultured Fretibacterium sp. TaxID=1678694 RepID=UPI00261D99A1|nr:phosphoribosylformylglycinamidine cyclo-ligase [uncultured Fretibacterium sp.]